MVAAFLHQISLFQRLSAEQIQALAKLVVQRTVAIEDSIIVAQEDGDTLFIIRTGQVKVSILHDDGREIILALLGPGELFGELALLDGQPRSANVVALEDTQLLLVRRPDFLQLLNEIPEIAIALLESLASRLRRTDSQVEGLALLDVTTRVSKVLIGLAEDEGIETPEGILIEERPPQQQLANMAGTTRESVSRVLKQLEDQGYIACDDLRILILPDSDTPSSRRL